VIAFVLGDVEPVVVFEAEFVERRLELALQDIAAAADCCCCLISSTSQ